MSMRKNPSGKGAGNGVQLPPYMKGTNHNDSVNQGSAMRSNQSASVGNFGAGITPVKKQTPKQKKGPIGKLSPMDILAMERK
jgi:hypothetical protein